MKLHVCDMFAYHFIMSCVFLFTLRNFFLGVTLACQVLLQVEHKLEYLHTRNTHFAGIPRCLRTTAWDQSGTSLVGARMPLSICLKNHYMI